MKEQYTTNTETTIFLSYSFRDNEIVDKIDSDLKSFEGINIVKCEREIGYTKSIKEFMRRVRITDYVLIVISDDFIKSMNCMYEINELSKDENYKSRILPVFPYANNDVRIAKIFKPEDRLEYIKYWNYKRDALDDKLKDLPRESTSYLSNDLNKYREICNTVGEFINTISDMNCFTFDKLKDENYKSILDKIEYVKFINRKLPIQSKPDIQIQKLLNDKVDLEKRLVEASRKDKWKQPVVDAVKENRFDDAIEMIEESNKPNDETSAEAHYELSGIYNLKLDFNSALYHSELAAKLQPFNSDYLHQAGFLCDTLGKYDDAIYYYNLALNFETEDRTEKATLLNNIGSSLRSKGEYDNAIENYEKALVIVKNFYGEEHPSIARYYNNIGVAWLNKGIYDKAIEYFEKALAIKEKIYDNEHPEISLVYNNFGGVSYSKGEYEKAIEYFEKALAIDKKYYGEEHPLIAYKYNNLGGIWIMKGNYDKAYEYFDKALMIDKKFYNDEHPDIAIRYNNIGGVFYRKRQYDKAIEYYENALTIDKKFHGEEHPSIARDYNNIGEALNKKGNYDKAIEYFEKTLAIDKKFHGIEHPDIACDYNNLASVLINKHNFDSAIEYYEKALAICKKFLGDNHPNTTITIKNLEIAREMRDNK